jgi:hypothetical protein
MLFHCPNSTRPNLGPADTEDLGFGIAGAVLYFACLITIVVQFIRLRKQDPHWNSACTFFASIFWLCVLRIVCIGFATVYQVRIDRAISFRRNTQLTALSKTLHWL